MSLFNVYPLQPIAITKALGSTVWNEKGEAYLDMYGGHAVISITSGSCYNAGVGAVANKAGELDTWDAIMVVSHRTLNEYNFWKKKGGSEEKLNAAMKRMNDKLKCKVIVLESFVDTKKSKA